MVFIDYHNHEWFMIVHDDYALPMCRYPSLYEILIYAHYFKKNDK